MVNPGFEFKSILTDRIPMMVEDIAFETLNFENEKEVIDLIRRNMEAFDKTDSVLAATFRRLNNLQQQYSLDGSKLFIARSIKVEGYAIACAGLGPLHGLPVSEGVGEIRDLVVDPSFRSQGIGSRLLHRCIEEAKKNGYRRLYLETSANMYNARKLFLRSGFRPVTGSSSQGTEKGDLPCYFLLEDLGGGGVK